MVLMVEPKLLLLGIKLSILVSILGLFDAGDLFPKPKFDCTEPIWDIIARKSFVYEVLKAESTPGLWLARRFLTCGLLALAGSQN